MELMNVGLVMPESCVTTLPELLRSRRVPDERELDIVVVHVRKVMFSALAAALPTGRVRVAVKYGRPGRSIRVDTSSVEVPAPARFRASAFGGRKSTTDDETQVCVHFGESCLVPASHRLDDLLRIRLMQAGFSGRMLAKAEVPLPGPGATADHDALDLVGPLPRPPRAARSVAALDLFGARRQRRRGGGEAAVVGRVGLRVERVVLTVGDLRRCLTGLGGRPQIWGLAIRPPALCEGSVVDGAEKDDDLRHDSCDACWR